MIGRGGVMVLLASALSLLAACQAPPQKAATALKASTTAAATTTPIVRKSATQNWVAPVRVTPFEVSAPGTYVHKGTQLALPVAAGMLTRTRIIQYDRDGMDVSANYIYDSGTRRLLISVYIFPVTAVAPDIQHSRAATEGACGDIARATASMAQTTFDMLYSAP